MPTITIETRIRAPIALVFDLARDPLAHAEQSSFTGERVVEPGKTSGLLEAGDLLTFEGRHLGVRQRLTVKITEMDAPRRFVDEGVRGAFRSLRHVHDFRVEGDETVMRDVIEWTSPFGILGRIADALFVTRHMRWFVTSKQQRLKQQAERSHSR
jgi:ligand-binding SRPBCC domain-containing protein